MEEESKKRQKLIDEERKKLVVEEVFLRLPPPSVARFKCLSKWWREFLSQPPFTERYQARNVSLLGFYHQQSQNTFVFNSIPFNFHPDISTGNLRLPGTQIRSEGGNTFSAISSSNGLLLLYSSNPTPQYLVYNPITRDKVYIGFPYCYKSIAKRYMVFGLAFDPYSANPCFTIAEVADSVVGGDDKIRIFLYCSLSSSWKTTHYKVPAAYLRNDYALSGPSTFYRGALHWLLEPSGVVAYDVRAKTFSFLLKNIPGDENYLENGFCRCVREMREGGLYSNGCCSCRYLGESRDQLIYIRVTGHSQFSLWTLKDYGRGLWSYTDSILVGHLPASLFFGRVLAFDRMEPHLLYLRVKNKIFSCTRFNTKLKQLCRITKEYGREENCLGVIIPYELPRITLSIPSNVPPAMDDTWFPRCLNALKHLNGDPSDMTEDMIIGPQSKRFWDIITEVQLCLNDDGVFHLYSQFGISQVAAKCLPHLQHVELNAARPPVWASYNFSAPFTLIDFRDMVVNYNDFIRTEACLYGCTAERGQQNL